MLQLTNITQDDDVQFTFPQRMFLPTIQTEHSGVCVSFGLCLLDLCCRYLGRESNKDIGLKIFKQILDFCSGYSPSCKFLYLGRGISNCTPPFGQSSRAS